MADQAHMQVAGQKEGQNLVSGSIAVAGGIPSAPRGPRGTKGAFSG